MAYKCPVCKGKLVQLRGTKRILPFFLEKDLVCKQCIGSDNKPLAVKSMTELDIQNGTPQQKKVSGNKKGFINAMNNFINQYK